MQVEERLMPFHSEYGTQNDLIAFGRDSRRGRFRGLAAISSKTGTEHSRRKEVVGTRSLSGREPLHHRQTISIRYTRVIALACARVCPVPSAGAPATPLRNPYKTWGENAGMGRTPLLGGAVAHGNVDGEPVGVLRESSGPHRRGASPPTGPTKGPGVLQRGSGWSGLYDVQRFGEGGSPCSCRRYGGVGGRVASAVVCTDFFHFVGLASTDTDPARNTVSTTEEAFAAAATAITTNALRSSVEPPVTPRAGGQGQPRCRG